ncbi:bifunctional diaminohydroxyphosphoribosylaminopyrimidine deaminase/5-amino-6-(5-phosphoribosylamino)uracil reductase RibD [Tenacibaculum sp. L6]|uniref:bifunctional diaminohydroxyphosphoribosylaminopyrimidine deaminase/5-amino-6-(5-phosphoribosylamino)uracil reductase RibD n=1 Tax=Tenacibaculum sp. L6 TaxID=2992764 RepID=UPI00237B4DE3|nr:bifunctional diaminohydroxyphosphoribosylaminopyrimidine deaminase/5-amino-6-(5-phosphoribosylamino)uracil reductase RibD [Tenacibaculum sp. L6]MDE0535091.1 bifunctional diaminohydroxyphosphoribosylaminopyrimidine deaminase/5-amino-6-(5-phosphoribosylamino)uracil reductase RibD [Tenacibaculum sp. L6]
MNHEKYIQRCLQLAKNGIGTTRPNPSVGAVIVHKNKIIGEGFTSPYGGPHAEVNAINSVQNQELLKEATIYVTLEPCSHHGKTPPCADLIIEKGIPNIVIGSVDTNSLVAGKGIERLKKAGRNVIVGVCVKTCKEHHKRFFTVQNKKRPYIILKWAETKDGFIAPLTKGEQKPVWISNAYSQQLVHKWRSEEHAILVGTNTVIADNPSLTVRSWSGNNPVRIVINKNLRIPSEATVLNGDVKTIVLVDRKERRETRKEKQEVFYEEIDFSSRVAEEICDVLHKHQIQSVIIEGGAQTLQTFIEANLWDEARVFIGDVNFGAGVKHPVFNAKLSSEEKITNDLLRIYKND